MNRAKWVVLILLMMTSGCHKLDNKFSRIELECGSGISFGEAYMKFVSSQNTEIQQAEENLVAYHISEAAMESSSSGQRIQVTSKGCVAIPNGESGRLDVFTKVPRQGISIHLNPSKPDFSKHQLMTIKENRFGFVCPLDGYFAVDSLSVPLLIPSDPNSFSERNRIVAYDEATKTEAILFEKPFGEAAAVEMKLFNTSSLKPGEYILKSTREVIDLRSETHLMSSELSTCPLTIVEKSPNLPDAILRLPESSILPLGSKLSWTSDRHSGMKFCRKQGEGCSKSEDFHEAREVLNQDEGVWDYCFLLENRAGRKSEILCKEIRVSGTKPRIHITIDTPAISTDLPILDFPTTRLKYDVQTEHWLATKSELQKTQTCRVEFSFHGQVNLATDTITCLSNECRGKSLKDFVPCGSELEIDISGLYRTNLINKAYLKFIVQVGDGAGNVSTRENSVLIDKDRWEYVALTGPGTNLENEKFETFFPITDDRVHMLTKSNKIFEYSPGARTWKELLDVSQLGPGDFLGLKTFVVMPDQTIYGLWRYTFNEKFMILRRLPGKPWELMTGDHSPSGCAWLSRDFAGNLYCKYKGLAYVYSGQSWNEITLTDSEGEELCYEQMHLTIVKQTQWVHCGTRLFSRRVGESRWIQRTEFGNGFPGNMIEDKHGNIWLASDPWSDEYFVGYFNPLGQWIDALAGKALKFQTSTIGVLSLSSSGDVHYGSLVWDSSVEDWKPRYSFLNPLAFMPLNEVYGSPHDSFLLWDSSLVISTGQTDYMFTFPADRWNVRSLEAIDYHKQSGQFFSVAAYAETTSLEKQLVSIRKSDIMNWLPVVTDNQLYDEFQLARLNSGETFFIAGKKLIYRQNPESGGFDVYRRFADAEDIMTGVDGQLVAAVQSGQLMFDVGEGSFVAFKLPQQLELNSDQFVKDKQLWAMDAKSPILHRIAPDGSIQDHNMPAECYGGSSTILTHTASHIYSVGGASPCVASFQDMVFRPLNIPGLPYEAPPVLMARLSMSRLALQASPGDNEFHIVDLEKQTLEGPFPLSADKLLGLQESPRSKQLFALYNNRVDRLVNGTWVAVMTSERLSGHLGRSDVKLKSLAVDREDSFLLATDAAPLLRIFASSWSQ